MSQTTMPMPLSPLESFQWTPQPQAQQLVNELVQNFLAQNAAGQVLAQQMTDDTGTRFVDWVDTIVVPHEPGLVRRLTSVGYEAEDVEIDTAGMRVYAQPHGLFPRVAIHEKQLTRVLVKADSVADFASANVWCDGELNGSPMAGLRTCCALADGKTELVAAERHGYRGFVIKPFDPTRLGLSIHVLESFRRRRRDHETDARGLSECKRLVDEAVAHLGRDLACDLFFQAEREYWQRRNRAAQVQKARQDKLGLGWANHDHHTYRSSRENFTRLIEIWEALGFKARERFYAGREAGWGAQVMEQPVTGITTFNDVDLSPEELLNDFAHEPMAARESLGTVGLWCGLHGDSILQAGMHHLECMFDFEALRDQLEDEAYIRTMKPFTTFPYLRQAFTEGERWKVSERRIERLQSRGLITDEQAQQFREKGAIGSHLENLERNDGFKGFNQEGVSEIIAATDPRKQRFLMGGA